MSTLADYIDKPTFERALKRLGTTPQEFPRLSGAEFSVLLDRYIRECADYIARLKARDDQVHAASRMSKDIPPHLRNVPLYELSKRGVIDEDEFRAGIQTLVRVQDEDEEDPNPHSDDVKALLDALAAAMGGDAG